MKQGTNTLKKAILAVVLIMATGLAAPLSLRAQSSDTTPFLSHAVHTNVLYDAALIPNVGYEICLASRWSAEVNWMGAWWNTKKLYWRAYGGHLALRRWFGGENGHAFTGHHAGVVMQAFLYDLCMGQSGYQSGNVGRGIFSDPTVSLGLEYGYTFRLRDGLHLDLSIGFGHLGGKYDKYKPSDEHMVYQSTNYLSWWGPTNAAVSLIWPIEFHRKGGAE